MQIPDMTRKFVCRKCQRETSHRPITHGRVRGSETPLEGSKLSYQSFQVLQCHECGWTTFCIDTKIDPGIGGDPYTKGTSYCPPLPFRLKPEWYGELPEVYRDILDEVYAALDNSLVFLASTGTRTALDRLIVEKIGDVGSFEAKLEKVCSIGTIDSDEKEMLLAVIDAGSASTHRSYKPDDKAINAMMDILEEIFYKMIVAPSKKEGLKAKAKALRETTPKRSPG